MASNIFSMSDAGSSSGSVNNISNRLLFKDYCFLVLVKDSGESADLIDKILTNGGTYEKLYFANKVNTFVTEKIDLLEARVKKAKGNGVNFIKPSWINACVSAGKLVEMGDHAPEEVRGNKRQRVGPNEDVVVNSNNSNNSNNNSRQSGSQSSVITSEVSTQDMIIGKLLINLYLIEFN